jgi:hypothetical protein
MIIDVRAENSYIFSNKVELSLKADMRYKKFGYNVHNENNFNVLKTVGVYGPNNVGKTCLLKSIRDIRNVLLNKKIGVTSNFFDRKNSISELGVTFLEGGEKHVYDFKYDTKEEEFIYERFSTIKRDSYGNEREDVRLIRDTINKEYFFEDETIQNMMKLTSKNNILIYLIDETEVQSFKYLKKILISFAEKIEYVDMNNIPMEKTIEILKNENDMHKKITNFIINADLDMDNFRFLNDSELGQLYSVGEGVEVQEKVLDLPDQVRDQIRLTSVYRGVSVPSLLVDSTGTKKIIALSSYIIDALENGKILIIDELDSSIHFKLSRAIVSMFNNELNRKAQLIFSVHDINLMDCKKLFRKEQIWFIHKDEDGVYLYSLADFTAAEGIRDTSDIIAKYKKGILGAVPNPDFINTLLEVNHAES